MSDEERAKYGYCPKCGEAFDRPYTHCPFCNEVNPHLEQDLAKKKDAVSEKLQQQLKANREWADANRAEVKAQVDAQIDQNLREMNQQIKTTTGSVTKGKSSMLMWLLIIAGAVVLGIGLRMFL
jgi:predicted ATP-dependent serine protease